jgi:hypothetical protein
MPSSLYQIIIMPMIFLKKVTTIEEEKDLSNQLSNSMYLYTSGHVIRIVPSKKIMRSNFQSIQYQMINFF